jgi:hypothetical protein
MAGLIQQNMAAGAPAPEQKPQPGMAPQQMPAEQMPPEQMPMGEMEEGEGPDPDTDPGYQQAMAFSMEALYGKEAAKNVAKSLKTGGDPVESLANTTYEIISIVDERTDGAIPDELLVLFASKILEEVADIGEAAGVQYRPSDVALALKQMILRFLGEQGVDTSQLQQAMDQVNPEEFNRMAPGDELEQEEVPA